MILLPQSTQQDKESTQQNAALHPEHLEKKAYEKQKKLMYEERKEYYTKNPEKVVEYYKERPIYDEQLRLEEIDKEKRLVDYYIYTKRSQDNYRMA